MNLFYPLTLFIAISLACHGVKADDVYNFYFQKDRAQLKAAKKVESEEAMKVRKAYQQHELTKIEENPLSRWSFRLGQGSIKYVGNADISYGQDVRADALVLGGRYLMNEYFDLDMEFLIPTGGGRNVNFHKSEQGGRVDDSVFDTTEINVGVGVTPLHISFFGKEVLLIGASGGLIYGNRFGANQLNTNNQLSVFLGPRVTVNLSRHFALDLSSKFQQGGGDFSHHSAAVSYQF